MSQRHVDQHLLILIGACIDAARGPELGKIRVELDLGMGQHLQRVT